MRIPLLNRPVWLKSRGYLHITPKISGDKMHNEIVSKVQDKNFVKRHGFFPLIHAVIKERKYKKRPKEKEQEQWPTKNDRSHRFKSNKGEITRTAKLRPLHYSTHIDSLIFAYYAYLLQLAYVEELSNSPGLEECITAYRKIALSNNTDEEISRGKSTINFAHEAFEEIKKRGIEDECVVLLFDIKSFFSELDHDLLKGAWQKLLNQQELDDDHFNVFKAATDFRYILLDELRIKVKNNSRKSGFDERKLSRIRKKSGIEAHFDSIDEFKKAIVTKQLTVYKHPFIKEGLVKSAATGTPISKSKKCIGIPQGLPISAVLANLYLLDFDKKVFARVVTELGCYYRRYSDDIMVICSPAQADYVKRFISVFIKRSRLKISEAKTETFLFKKIMFRKNEERLTSILLSDNQCVIGRPLTYLGFEFYGYKTLIRSTNLAKFYRRLIYSVKRQASRAKKLSEKEGLESNFIFLSRLKRKYSFINLDKSLSKLKEFKRKKLIRNKNGDFVYKFDRKERKYKSNYFSYVLRASRIMKEPAILKQIRKHKAILREAIDRHLYNRC